MTDLKTLQSQLAEIQAQIDETRKAEKAMKKLQKMKLNARTSHKYFDLQAAYMESLRHA